MRFRLPKYVVVALAVLIACGFGSARAQADESGALGYVWVMTAERSCPDTRCSTVGQAIPATAPVRVYCWRDAGSFLGTNRWFRVTYGGVVGWISAATLGSPQPVVQYCSTIRPNEALFAGQLVWSPKRFYHLVMQGDGNLVMYAGYAAPYVPLWATRTNTSGAWMMMQSDGNLVVYNSTATQALWSTGTGGTPGNPGAWLSVQDDGNLVLYSGSFVLYASAWHETWGSQGAVNFGYPGNCTSYALQRFAQYSGDYWPNWAVANHNAWQWATDAHDFGWNVQPNPSAHSIVVFPRGVDDADPTYGHVAWVTGVRYHSDGSAWIDVAEMSYGVIGYRNNLPVTGGMSFIMAPSR